jgi:hypothetical protein
VAPGPVASTARRRPDAKNNTSEKRSHCQRERNLSGTLPTLSGPVVGAQRQSSMRGLQAFACEQCPRAGHGVAGSAAWAALSIFERPRPRRPCGMQQMLGLSRFAVCSVVRPHALRHVYDLHCQDSLQFPINAKPLMEQRSQQIA